MRLFIAVMIPHELHQYCAHIQSRFPSLNKTRAFHLTLHFLGDGIENAEPIIQALSAIQFKPFEIEMRDAVPFPNPFRPQGVWIECDPSSALLSLAEDIRNAMTNLGYRPDKPFRAHITLGRYQPSPRQKPKPIKGESHRFVLDKFYLIESVREPEGSAYKILATFPVGS